MRFCSLSAVRARCSLARPRDLFVKAFGLRAISAAEGPSPSPAARLRLPSADAFFLATFLPAFFFLCAPCSAMAVRLPAAARQQPVKVMTAAGTFAGCCDGAITAIVGVQTTRRLRERSQLESCWALLCVTDGLAVLVCSHAIGLYLMSVIYPRPGRSTNVQLLCTLVQIARSELLARVSPG